MRLLETIGYNYKIKVIALIGAGGKTTTMYRIASCLNKIGKKVICTTTTHILKPKEKYPFPVLGTPMKDNPEKLSAVSVEDYQRICKEYDVVLVEADGAKGMYIKLPASHEPVIPKNADLVLCIASMGALNKPLKEVCHRTEIVSKRLNITEDSIVKISDIAKVLKIMCTEVVPKNMKAVPILTKVIMERGEVITATELFPNCGNRCIIDENHELYNELKAYFSDLPKIVTIADKKFFLEKITSSPELIIAGGGHVGLATAKLGAFIGMKVTVIDSRGEFADKERFSMADKVLCCDFKEGLSHNYGSNAYFVIATQGHEYDEEALEAVLANNYRYAGMIGSKKKTAFVMENLIKKGWSQDILAKVHAPIGLNINAATPEEIAISIIAEIIQEMNNGRAVKNMPDVFSFIEKNDEAMVLATIIDKEGSSPRGIGTRMVVRADGSIVGTIGGGKVEAAVIKDASDILKNGNSKVIEYGVNFAGNNSLGMACGGAVKVLLEIAKSR